MIGMIVYHINNKLMGLVMKKKNVKTNSVKSAEEKTKEGTKESPGSKDESNGKGHQEENADAKSEEKSEKEAEKKDESENKTVTEKKDESEDKTMSEKKDESEDKKVTEKKDESKDKTASDKREYKSLYIEQEPYVDISVRKHKKKKRIIRTVMMILLGIVILCYLGGVGYFYNHFSCNTTLNGYDISYQDISEVDAVMQNKMNAYVLNVKFKNGEDKVRVGDGGLSVQLEESVKSIKNRQNPFIWFIDIFESDNYTVDYIVSYDEKAMREYISGMEYMQTYNMEPSVDAKVRMENGEAVLIPDVTGTELKTDTVYAVVFAALNAYETEADIEGGKCYIPAKITTHSEVIAKGMRNAKNFLAINAEYDFAGYKVQISKEDLCTFAYIDNRGDIVISRTNVECYAREFAEKYSTSYTDRKFRTHDWKTITVYGGYYGWQLDPEQETEELYNLLCEQQSFTKEPACEHRGYAYGEDNDIGNTYVEVDLSDQHVYVYIDGRMEFDTPCVSGKSSQGYGTPGGLFGITYKALNVTLRGADYETPVTFWMPFNGGIGMHDATWRGSFGGSIYYYDGSHGCVNLPYSAAATIFNMVEPGMPVVCYWD